jgi:Domain of unknown function (DUF4412)
MRRSSRISLLLTLAAAPVWAGMTFTQVTRTAGGPAEGAGDMVLTAWVDGGQAKLQWDESNNPIFTPGSYMLVNEKGEITLVNPDKKTYSKFDLAAMMEGVDQSMGAASQFGFKLEIEDPKVEKVLEEPGPEMLGYPTTHYRWHTTYTTVMHMPRPMHDRRMPSDQMEDVWTTTAIGIPMAASKAFAGMEGGGAMMGELRKLADAAKAKMTGFPLKRVSVTTSEGGRRNREMTTTMEVKDLKTMDVPASTFAIPAQYTETDLMQPQRGPAMPNLNQQQ